MVNTHRLCEKTPGSQFVEQPIASASPFWRFRVLIKMNGFPSVLIGRFCLYLWLSPPSLAFLSESMWFQASSQLGCFHDGSMHRGQLFCFYRFSNTSPTCLSAMLLFKQKHSFNSPKWPYFKQWNVLHIMGLASMFRDQVFSFLKIKLLEPFTWVEERGFARSTKIAVRYVLRLWQQGFTELVLRRPTASWIVAASSAEKEPWQKLPNEVPHEPGSSCWTSCINSINR